jgi:hypothetical protein
MVSFRKTLTSVAKTPANIAVIAALAIALVAGAAAVPALAQSPQDLPSYAVPGDTTIHGTVRTVDDPYHITVHDANGYVDHVTLHDGTIINPRGLKLTPGQTVTILGQPSGGTFAANEIDTPYSRYGYPYPYRAYYPYPVYPYPAYGYYPAFGFGFRTPGFGFHAFI